MAKTGRERIAELRVFRDIYHHVMRPSDVPFFEIVWGRMAEVYHAVRDFRGFYLPVVIAIKYFLTEWDVDPRIHLVFSIPGTLMIACFIVVVFAIVEYFIFLYMVLKGNIRKVVENKCAICLTNIENNGETNGKRNKRETNDMQRIVLHCQHSFHEKCISKWLEYKQNCPLCRNRVYWKKSYD